MPTYVNSGNLVTDSREIASSETWETDADWQANQESDGVLITSDTIRLAAFQAPDADVYLHDDFGDGKLQNRDDSATLTYNGQTGYYRPEWTIHNGNPTVTNNQLNLVGMDSDAIYHQLNLNMSEIITWEYTGLDVSGGSPEIGITLFTESANYDTGFPNGFYPGYSLHFKSDGTARLYRYDDANNFPLLISGTLSNGSGNVTVTYNSGSWELILNGSSAGTASDSTYTNPQYTGVSARQDRDADFTLDEMKVY